MKIGINVFGYFIKSPLSSQKRKYGQEVTCSWNIEAVWILGTKVHKTPTNRNQLIEDITVGVSLGHSHHKVIKHEWNEKKMRKVENKENLREKRFSLEECSRKETELNLIKKIACISGMLYRSSRVFANVFFLIHYLFFPKNPVGRNLGMNYYSCLKEGSWGRKSSNDCPKLCRQGLA